MGLTVAFSTGTNINYVKFDSVEYSRQYLLENNLPYWIAEQLLDFRFFRADGLYEAKSPVFECESIFKYGFFTYHPNQNIISIELPTLIQNCVYDSCDASYLEHLKDNLIFYRKLDYVSEKIIITLEEGNTVYVLHFAMKNGKWYITIIDFYSQDCSC